MDITFLGVVCCKKVAELCDERAWDVCKRMKVDIIDTGTCYLINLLVAYNDNGRSRIPKVEGN